MSKIERKNGYIFLNVVSSDEDAYYAEAYNFSKGIFGYGDDMRDWENHGDLWGHIKEMYLKEDGRYSIAIAEEQFTANELEEIETKR